MKKIRMCFPKEKTFADGFAEYVLDCKARNLRNGTIHHYQESIKQIYKRIPPDTPISSMNKQTMADFYIALRDDPNLNEVSMGTYARDLKTLMRFFMKCQNIPHFEIQLPKADKAPIKTYTDDELRKLLKKPDVRKCIFSTYSKTNIPFRPRLAVSTCRIPAAPGRTQHYTEHVQKGQLYGQ